MASSAVEIDRAHATIDMMTRMLSDGGCMQITDVDVADVRFPTSVTKDGSDAMNKDGDYSAVYVTLRTSTSGDAGAITADDGQSATLTGYGLTFTIGRGNDVVALAAEQIAARLVGVDVAEMAADMGGTYRRLTDDSQMRWLGPEKGAVHLALAAVMNAAWDLAGRFVGKPVW